MEYKIESGVPIPGDPRGRKSHSITVTADKLEVGESFVFESDPSALNALYMSARRKGKKYRIFHCGNGEARVWRVK